MATAYEATREDITSLLAGQPRYRVDQVWHGLYRRALRPEEMTELPKRLRARLAAELPPALTLVAERVSDRGATSKWLWSLAGGAAIETVLMRYPGRTTVCVSTQAGCAMGCSFCATGQAGFSRHLSTGEIVEQVAAAMRASAPDRLSNVVFMGMGEPLANYDRTWEAVRRLHDDMGVSARHLTISTVGVVPGIRRLAHETLPVGLAVSLHAANDGLRDRLVPLNRRYPLASLMEVCRQYRSVRGRRISFEWALVAGVNDQPSDAQELAGLARPMGAHVNLIPLNPTPGYRASGTDPAGVRRFRDRLQQLGVNATVRRNRGTDINAACGQLAATGSGRAATVAATGGPGDRLGACPPTAGSTRPSRRP